jgi:hypothetical protein
MLALTACFEDPLATSADATRYGSINRPGTATNTSTSSPTTSNAATASNIAPTFTNAPPTQAVAGNFYDFTLSATDPDSITLTFAAQGLPAWLKLDGKTGRLSGTPANSDAGQSPDILLSVSDGTNQTSLPAFHITIAAVTPPTPPPAPSNQPPTISGTPPTTVVATKPYDFTPTAADADSPVLTFTIINKPAWASFSSTTGRLSGTPNRTQTGTTNNITITVSDGSLSAKLPAFSITVSPAPNLAPAISGTPATTVQVGKPYSFTPTATDADGDTITFVITNKPTWATFNKNTGQLSGTPTAAAVGTYPGIVIAASDNIATTPLPTFSITVTAAPNNPPTISGSPATLVQAGSSYSFTPTARDADGDALSFTVINKPDWLNFSLSTGQLSGTPTAAQVGSYPGIEISVTDGKATAKLAAFTLTVNAAPASSAKSANTGTATLNWTQPTQNTDGSTLTNLAGYRAYHGLSADALTEVKIINDPRATTTTFDQLASGMHYFAVSSVNAAGVESALSSVGSKSIP